MTGLLIVLAFLAGMGATAFAMLIAAADTDRDMQQREPDFAPDVSRDIDQAIANMQQPRSCRLRSVGHAKGRA